MNWTAGKSFYFAPGNTAFVNIFNCNNLELHYRKATLGRQAEFSFIKCYSVHAVDLVRSSQPRRYTINRWIVNSGVLVHKAEKSTNSSKQLCTSWSLCLIGKLLNFGSNNLFWINKVAGQQQQPSVLSLVHNLLIDFTELKLTVKRLCSFTKWSSIEMMDHNITSGHIIAMIIMHFLEFNSNFISFVDLFFYLIFLIPVHKSSCVQVFQKTLLDKWFLD